MSVMRVRDWVGIAACCALLGGMFGLGARSRDNVLLEGRCMEACAPREFEQVIRGSQCLCKGDTALIHLRSVGAK